MKRMLITGGTTFVSKYTAQYFASALFIWSDE